MSKYAIVSCKFRSFSNCITVTATGNIAALLDNSGAVVVRYKYSDEDKINIYLRG